MILNIMLYYLFIIFIIFIIYYWFLGQYVYKDKYKFKEILLIPDIPKTIIQTYFNKSKIPDKVYKNINKYAPAYKHIIYDDNDCIKFLYLFDQKFGNGQNKAVKTYNKLKGAHKADLFRYCYLYMNGGIYLDIKTELIKPIDQIFNKNNTLYTCIGAYCGMYQGIIAVPPRNYLIGTLINHILSKSKIIIYIHYFIFCMFMKHQIKSHINNDISPRYYNIKNNFNVELFEEVLFDPIHCYDGPDRHGFCSFILSKGKPIIKTRYSDYPW
jgi:hypothetical protein